MPFGEKLDCNLWEWQMVGSNYYIKGKNYSKSPEDLDSAIPETEPMDYF